MQLVEFGVCRSARQLFRALTGGGNQPHWHGFLHARDNVSVASFLVPYNVWRSGLVFAVDSRRIGIWRFHNMGISRNNWFGNHAVGHVMRTSQIGLPASAGEDLGWCSCSSPPG